MKDRILGEAGEDVKVLDSIWATGIDIWRTLAIIFGGVFLAPHTDWEEAPSVAPGSSLLDYMP